MRATRLLVFLLAIVAPMQLAIAATGATKTRAVTIKVEKCVVTRREGKFVRSDCPAITPLGTVHLWQTPGRAYVHLSRTEGFPSVTVRKDTLVLDFYDEAARGGTQTARAYWVGRTLVIPVTANGSGSGCNGGSMAFVFLRKGQAPVVSRRYGSTCSGGAYMRLNPDESGGTLVFVALSNTSPKIRTYRYQADAFTLVSTQTPAPPPGFSALITAQAPLKTVVVHRRLSLQIDSDGILYINGVKQPDPNSPDISIDGVAAKFFHHGSRDVAILQVDTDDADGPKLQVLEVGKTHLRYSRLFGVKGSRFVSVFYKDDAGRLYLDFVDYRTGYGYGIRCGLHYDRGPCPSGKHKSAYKKDGPFSLLPFVYSPGALSTTGPLETIMGRAPWPDLPVTVRRALHGLPPRWVFLTNDGRCVPAHPRDPAALVQFDRGAAGLQDEIVIFEKGGGLPIGVKVAEPEPGGMVTVYTFFRTRSACTSFAASRSQMLKSLQ